MTDNDQPITVTQADRDAAAELFERQYTQMGGMVEAIREGSEDDHSFVQAFAKLRTTHAPSQPTAPHLDAPVEGSELADRLEALVADFDTVPYRSDDSIAAKKLAFFCSENEDILLAALRSRPVELSHDYRCHHCKMVTSSADEPEQCPECNHRAFSKCATVEPSQPTVTLVSCPPHHWAHSPTSERLIATNAESASTLIILDMPCYLKTAPPTHQASQQRGWRCVRSDSIDPGCGVIGGVTT